MPLEELETHLRDEIEQQIKTGLSEGDAFTAAALEIGKACELRTEFSKVDAGHRISPEIRLTFGWLAAGGALCCAIGNLNLDWNFFNFCPEWKLMTVVNILGIAAMEIVFWYLAKTRRHRMSRVISLVLCLLLAFIAFYFILPPEPNSKAVVTGTGDPADLARLAEALSRVLEV
ncbi:MAG TPA: permease prefix domain 1-containing protein [Candidatus Sulfotelmatobacter sp.]|nr:permease prefix domain 1-containing protein [Candidatus Sulfotelmatobacter sp.]